MIHIYDGNNVMRRAMENSLQRVPGVRPMSLRQRYEDSLSAPAGSQIWAWDGYKHNDRRRALYPPYKMNREPTPMDMFAQIKLFRELLDHSHAVQVEVHGWEADDVISTFVRKFVRAGRPVTVHSNDMDYAQLADLPGVTLNGVNTKGVPGRWIALYKALVGDKSDNIAGINGFGQKRWDELADHWPQIERAVVQGSPAGFVGLPFKPAVLAWLSSQDNVDTLRQMFTITHFEDVPDDELDGGMKIGTVDRVKAYARLQEFFL